MTNMEDSIVSTRSSQGLQRSPLGRQDELLGAAADQPSGEGHTEAAQAAGNQVRAILARDELLQYLHARRRLRALLNLHRVGDFRYSLSFKPLG